MHVAIVSETYPPEVNGVALTVAGLEQGLRCLGHTVSVVRPRQPGITEPPNSHDLLVAGAALPRYPELRFGFPAGAQLEAHWRRARPDVIYVATEGPLGWSAVNCAAHLAIPVATGFHTRFDDYASRYGLGILTPLVFAWLRRFHNRADATIVPTEELAGFLRQRGFQRVAKLSRGVDSALFDPAHRDPALRAGWGLSERSLCLVHVGRLAAEKDLPLAIRAFRAIQAQQEDARFVLVGDGPARASLQRAHPDLIFAGVRRGADLARHFASADLFLFPSQSETFGNVTLEAMASGVATVAFDYGAAREHLRDGQNGATVPLGDASAFVARSRHLALDPVLRKRLADAARRAVLPLSPIGVARDFADLLGGLRSRKAA